MSSSSLSSSPSRDGASPVNAVPRPLVDFFITVGLNPKEDFATDCQIESLAMVRSPLKRPYCAHVLSSLPPSRPWSESFDPDSVIMLCFPRGLRFKRTADDRRIRFHTFVMTKEDGSRVYGANLIFYERVEDPNLLGAMQMLQAMHEQQQACDASPAVRASASRIRPESPGASEFNSAKDNLYAPKSICILSKIPAVACFEQYLRQLYAVSQMDNPPMSLDCYIANLLSEVPLPPPGKTLSFRCLDTIICHRPSSVALPLFEYSIRRLFALFPADAILKLFTCALVEHQIIIRSNDYELLVLVSECITGLMYPFTWQHVYVPILPSTLLHFVEAPVPYIMGLHADVAMDVAQQAQCVVEIDHGTIKLPEDLPSFPNSTALIKKLNDLVKDVGGESSGCANLLAAGGAKGLHALLSGAMLPPLPNNPGTLEDYKFTAAVREAFLRAWADIFQTYESYVIIPENAELLDEGSPFDKMAFLSDQPRKHLPFLSRFVETQSFTSFIDAKVSNMVSESAGEEEGLSCFDRLVRVRRDTHSELPTLRSDGSIQEPSLEHALPLDETLSSLTTPQAMGLEGSITVDFAAPEPHTVMDSPTKRRNSTGGAIAAMRAQAKVPPPSMRLQKPTHASSPKIQRKTPKEIAEECTLGKKAFPTVSGDTLKEYNPIGWPASSKKIDSIVADKKAEKRKKSQAQAASLTVSEASAHAVLQAAKDLRERFKAGPVGAAKAKPAAADVSQIAFIEALMTELASKVKKIILVMMGSSSANAKVHEDNIGYENTMVANLCQLLERMWRHGFNSNDSKSALWDFLELAKAQPLSEEVKGDIVTISGMNFIHTDVGRARAWIRLLIEKKTLSKTFEELLRQTKILEQLYKEHAFLRHEEMRIQMLSHLLSLTTVDFNCFSANYAPAMVNYHISIYTSKAFRSGTSNNVFISITGDLGSLGPIGRTKGQSFATGAVHEFTVENANLGPLKFVTIGHDNSALSSHWVVDRVEVKNLLTNRVFVFPCGRKVEDGDEFTVKLPVQLQAPKSRDADKSDQPPAASDEIVRMHDETSESFAGAINSIVRYFHSSEEKRSRFEEACLVLGVDRFEMRGGGVRPEQFAAMATTQGLCREMYKLIKMGFKTKTMFAGTRHIWDFLEKLHHKVRTELESDPETLFHKAVETANATSWPKTAKFEWLIAYGAGHHVLHVWLELIASGVKENTLYDDSTIFRYPDRSQLLFAMVRYLVEFSFEVHGYMKYIPNEDKSKLGKWQIIPK